MKMRAILLATVSVFLSQAVGAGLLANLDTLADSQLQLACQPRQYQNWQTCARVCREQVPECISNEDITLCREKARECEKHCKETQGC